jgi:phosphoribosyl 1,2-cyclic phosphodiesterase
MRAGVDVFTGQGTIDALELSGHRIHAVRANKQYKIGDWTILPLEAVHDAPDPLSFLIANSVGEKLLFATDTAYIMNRFVNLSVIAVECNYQSEILDQNIKSGLCEPGLKDRLLRTHLSLNNVIEFLKANDLKAVRSISLLHLSSRNANAEQMKDAIVKMFGKPVFVCGMADHVLEFGNGGVKVN